MFLCFTSRHEDLCLEAWDKSFTDIIHMTNIQYLIFNLSSSTAKGKLNEYIAAATLSLRGAIPLGL